MPITTIIHRPPGGSCDAVFPAMSLTPFDDNDLFSFNTFYQYNITISMKVSRAYFIGSLIIPSRTLEGLFNGLLLIPHLIYLNLAAIIAIIDYNIALIAKVRVFFSYAIGHYSSNQKSCLPEGAIIYRYR
jgi:hypothetical protein